MITVDEAIAIIAKTVQNMPPETIRVTQAAGRTLAEAPIARLTHPPARMSAMDGYAVALDAPIGAGTTLPVIGEAPAGKPFVGELTKGAVRIFTGSVMPEGSNHVVVQEEVEREGDLVTLTAPQTKPQHVREAGTDFMVGDALLPKGRVIGPIDQALLTASGLRDVEVIRQPKIALFANGDELVEADATPDLGQVVNSITAGLQPLFESWGARVVDLGVARDDERQVRDRFREAADADLVIPIGGASVGDYDVVKRIGRELFDLAFEKVAVKPGKPVWFGAQGHQYVLGLPGNPSSAFACSHIFGRMVLGAMLGEHGETLTLETAQLAEPLGPNGQRENFIRAVIDVRDDGQLYACAQAKQDTALLSPFAASNALLRRAAGEGPLEAGALVKILRL